MRSKKDNSGDGKAVAWNIAFQEVQDGWLHHDVQTDFWKFRVDCDRTLTDGEIRRISGAMVKAAAVEFLHLGDAVDEAEEVK